MFGKTSKTSYGSTISNIRTVTVNSNGSITVRFNRIKATTAKAACTPVKASKIVKSVEAGAAYTYTGVPVIVRKRIMREANGRSFNRMFKSGRQTRGDFGCEKLEK